PPPPPALIEASSTPPPPPAPIAAPSTPPAPRSAPSTPPPSASVAPAAPTAPSQPPVVAAPSTPPAARPSAPPARSSVPAPRVLSATPEAAAAAEAGRHSSGFGPWLSRAQSGACCTRGKRCCERPRRTGAPRDGDAGSNARAGSNRSRDGRHCVAVAGWRAGSICVGCIVGHGRQRSDSGNVRFIRTRHERRRRQRDAQNLGEEQASQSALLPLRQTRRRDSLRAPIEARRKARLRGGPSGLRNSQSLD